MNLQINLCIFSQFTRKRQRNRYFLSLYLACLDFGTRGRQRSIVQITLGTIGQKMTEKLCSDLLAEENISLQNYQINELFGRKLRRYKISSSGMGIAHKSLAKLQNSRLPHYMIV